jgi:hypothetical protein
MPSVVSPAQVKTGNGANMYVPIDGNTAVFPPILETPSVNGSNINGLGAPFLISTSVIVNGRSPYTTDLRALSMNGPMYVNYNLNLDNPYVPSFDVSGDTVVEGNTTGKSLLIAQDIFKIPVDFKDFQGLYNLGPTYCMDFGSSRFVWGEVFNVSTNGTRELGLKDIPANTFTQLPQQNAIGLFDTTSDQTIVGMGATTNYTPDPLGPGGIIFYGLITKPSTTYPFSPGNLWLATATSGYNYSFLAVGPIKSAPPP